MDLNFAPPAEVSDLAQRVADFVKTTSIIAYTEKRLRRAGDQIVRLARAEGLEAHARAVLLRLEAEGS